MTSKIDAHFARLMLDSLRAENADGGEGSGNFNHAGRPGEVGGSAPSEGGGGSGVEAAKPKKERFSALNDNARKQMQDIRDNYYTHMPDSDKQAKVQSLIKSLGESGIKVTSNPDEWGNPHYKVAVDGLSREEVNDIQEVLGWGVGGFLSDEDYIAECKAVGQTPDLHVTPDEINPAYLKKSDGTPVYMNLSENSVLSAEDINKYENPENVAKRIEASQKAVSEWIPEEYKAMKDYTSQWGVNNYQDVNECLVTGEGSESVKKAAEEVTKALNHPIGADCVTHRGIQTDEIGQITNNPKAAKYIAQIERGDFSHAKDLRDILNGLEVTNPAVMSTSAYYDYNYGQRAINMMFKTPAEAKAVDLSQISNYAGGRNGIESKLAAAMGKSMSYEHEIAYKPNTKYRIDSVDFSFTPARKGQKAKGKIILVCSVLTD